MITTTSAFAGNEDSGAGAGRFAGLLQEFYSGLLEQGVPDHLASLVRQLKGSDPRSGHDGRKLALIVEANSENRTLAALLLDETGLAVVECASAEAAITVLQSRGGDVAFIFADEDLAGPRDGYNLARTAATLWPRVRIVLTTAGAEVSPEGLPGSVIIMTKPWRGLDVLIEAERALAFPSSASLG